MTFDRILRAAIISLYLLFAFAQHGIALGSPVESARPNESEQQQIESALRLQAFALDPFEKPIGDSKGSVGERAKLLERFGRPNKQESSRFPDRTSDLMLTYMFLQYDGVAFHVIEDEDHKHSWIERIEITGNSHALKYGLHIGSTRSAVISLFQPADYLVDKNPMRLSTNGVQNPPNMAVWEGPTIDVAIDFDSTDLVTRIVVESIEL